MNNLTNLMKFKQAWVLSGQNKFLSCSEKDILIFNLTLVSLLQ